MTNKDISTVYFNALLLSRVSGIPFKISRRVDSFKKVLEKVTEGMQEIAKSGEERKAEQEEIEKELEEYGSKECDISFEPCHVSWFDDIQNTGIPYKDGEAERIANSHAIINLLIEKGFIVE